MDNFYAYLSLASQDLTSKVPSINLENCAPVTAAFSAKLQLYSWRLS